MKLYLLTTLAFFILLLPASRCLAESDEIKSLCEIDYPSDAAVEWECRQLKWKDTPLGVFGERWPDALRFNRLDRRHFLGGMWIKVPVDLEEVRDFSPLPDEYPDAEQEEKFILVDLDEMFLGAYEYGEMVHSFPVAVGIREYPVPKGEFRIDAVDRRHKSNLYKIEELDVPYPMHYGLRFHVDNRGKGSSYWIHGRDLPGYPASHGCIGLYDEEMQNEYYGDHDREAHKKNSRQLTEPYLEGAKELYDWVIGDHHDSGKFHKIKYGPKVLIVGSEPVETP